MSLLRRSRTAEEPSLPATIAGLVRDQHAGLVDQFTALAENPRLMDAELLLIDLRSLTANLEKLALLLREGRP